MCSKGDFALIPMKALFNNLWYVGIERIIEPGRGGGDFHIKILGVIIAPCY